MSDWAIRARGVGKKYRIGRRERYRTFRETISEMAMAPFRWGRGGKSADTESQISNLKSQSSESKGQSADSESQISNLKSEITNLKSQSSNPGSQNSNLKSAISNLQSQSSNLEAQSSGVREPSDGTFWALEEVSFEVKKGESVGIIGWNGAGKSTLLKILSRITDMTEGEVEMEGRVGSLLEVGTGFHTELTGRENIYLNGAILGMRRGEIARKFDEIVAFSEVEKFLDTPVKHYSSGMYMRLAFAVAAHLDPEILIVDEVLAVGDAAFQKKCLGKMSEVAKGGRTVIFVSHNMAAITRLCTHGIHLQHGRVSFDGTAEGAVARYAAEGATDGGEFQAKGIKVRVAFADEAGQAVEAWGYDRDIVAEVSITADKRIADAAVDLAFYSESGVRVFAVQSDRLDGPPFGIEGNTTLRFRLRNIGLACGSVTADVGIRKRNEGGYIAWWQQVGTVALSARETRQQTASETIVTVPCQLEVREARR